ncbi:YtxH domain-containing protein [uncultured Alistipes sp.]|uniref:YtxH domain-containing protein n=1 Tax=uncultured Alistipes sp. TaxID=538949 RepID=UPI001FA580B0|nr:YtxH domain-containing protein [uncultured Alistipes sp.]HJC26443.1 YtxH domain-containing protein [Candidatus Alistipes stercoravium]
MKNTGIVIASLVGGMILGSALTMLLTPQSGPELRRKIKDLVGDELDRVQEKIGEVETRIDEIRCQCEEK